MASSTRSLGEAEVEAQPDSERRFTRGRLSRGKGLRKTTGCLTCRRRHIKCDEAKPICRGCAKRKVPCVYDSKPDSTSTSGSGLSVVSGSGSAGSTAAPNSTRGSKIAGSDIPVADAATTAEAESVREVIRASLSPAAAPAALASLEPPALYGTTEPTPHSVRFSIAEPDHQLANPLGRPWVGHSPQAAQSPEEPRLYQNSISTTFDGLPPAHHASNGGPPAFDPASASSASHTAESPTARWLGLLLGDATVGNGVLPDIEYELDGFDIFGNSIAQSHASDVTPASPATTRAGLEVPVGVSPNTCNPSLQERIPHLRSDQLSEKQAWHSSDAIELLPYEHMLFMYFVQHISQWMDLFEPKRPFGTFVPHLAMHNVGLMNAILALSARHLSLGTGHPAGYADASPPDANDAVRYYFKTLHYSQKAMQYDTYKTSLELLAISLIISTYEMLDGSSTDWERHLKGVFWIQRSQVIHGDSGGLRQAVWWAWLCQDVWAAFREKRKPFTFWRPERTFDALDPFELAARSVHIFAQVVGFCSTEEMEETKNDLASRMSRADVLLEKLEDWRRHLTVEFEALPVSTSSGDAFQPIWLHPPVFGVAIQLYYCSLILIYLNRPTLGGLDVYLEQQKSLRTCIKAVCGIAMTLTDYASGVMSSQCVFIAGLSVERIDQQNAVLEILAKCRQRTGWPVQPLEDELRLRWERH